METEPKLIEQYIATGKLKLIYRHLVQMGEGSQLTAEASECAADQGKFWEMRAMLYSRQDEIYGSTDVRATLAGFAQDLGLDAGAFGECMQSGTHREAVQADFRAAQAEDIRSRPVFDIAGQRILGAQPLERFQQVIDAALPR